MRVIQQVIYIYAKNESKDTSIFLLFSYFISVFEHLTMATIRHSKFADILNVNVKQVFKTYDNSIKTKKL